MMVFKWKKYIAHIVYFVDTLYISIRCVYNIDNQIIKSDKLCLRIITLALI